MSNKHLKKLHLVPIQLFRQDLVEEAAELDTQNASLHSMYYAISNQYVCTCQKKK